jgi:hypothetical protein
MKLSLINAKPARLPTRRIHAVPGRLSASPLNASGADLRRRWMRQGAHQRTNSAECRWKLLPRRLKRRRKISLLHRRGNAARLVNTRYAKANVSPVSMDADQAGHCPNSPNTSTTAAPERCSNCDRKRSVRRRVGHAQNRDATSSQAVQRAPVHMRFR